tara:strand:- start:107 stop:625 length:519 start_codon:yes stop_codon:yes gene_type:complete
MPPTIRVCSPCAAGIANDDWTHLDYHGDSEAAFAAIRARVATLGLLSFRESVDDLGDFTCECCKAVLIEASSALFNWTHQITLCPVSVDGHRCGEPVIGGFGWRRCADHAQTKTGLNLNKKQRNVLRWLAGTHSRPDRAEKRITQTVQSLIRRRLVTGDWIITPWGRDVAGS